MYRIANLFFNPEALFLDIKNREKQPYSGWLIYISLIIAVTILIMPLMIIKHEVLFPDWDFETIHLITKYPIWIALFVVLYYVFLTLLKSFVLYWLVKIINIKIEFKQVVQLLVYLNILVLAGTFLSLFIIYFNKIDSIESIYDLYRVIGPNLFLDPEQIGHFWFIFLSNINLVSTWYVILLVVGLKNLSGVYTNKVTIFACLCWLLEALVSTI